MKVKIILKVEATPATLRAAAAQKGLDSASPVEHGPPGHEGGPERPKGERDMSDEKKQTVVYASAERFNGQPLSLGQVVLVSAIAPADDQTPIWPSVVKEIGPAAFITVDGSIVAFEGFVPEPGTARRDDGQVVVHLDPGQWCWLPRV